MNIKYFLILWLLGCGNTVLAQDSAFVEVRFENVVGKEPLLLYDQEYVNGFGEHFIINKFKYYLSHITIGNREMDGIFLIDEKHQQSKILNFSMPATTIASLHFQIGVDSIFNVSGAQTGALDPRNDMFWTWNTGYIMAKLEGTSKDSKIVNGKYEYHIGGFAAQNNVLQQVKLTFDPVKLEAGKKTTIVIRADVNCWFQGSNHFKIADKPAINAPGAAAVKMSQNYADMFSIIKLTSKS